MAVHVRKLVGKFQTANKKYPFLELGDKVFMKVRLGGQHFESAFRVSLSFHYSSRAAATVSQLARQKLLLLYFLLSSSSVLKTEMRNKRMCPFKEVLKQWYGIHSYRAPRESILVDDYVTVFFVMQESFSSMQKLAINIPFLLWTRLQVLYFWQLGKLLNASSSIN